MRTKKISKISIASRFLRRFENGFRQNNANHCSNGKYAPSVGQITLSQNLSVKLKYWSSAFYDKNWSEKFSWIFLFFNWNWTDISEYSMDKRNEQWMNTQNDIYCDNCQVNISTIALRSIYKIKNVQRTLEISIISSITKVIQFI